jgi:hypothetical protein
VAKDYLDERGYATNATSAVRDWDMFVGVLESFISSIVKGMQSQQSHYTADQFLGFSNALMTFVKLLLDMTLPVDPLLIHSVRGL